LEEKKKKKLEGPLEGKDKGVRVLSTVVPGKKKKIFFRTRESKKLRGEKGGRFVSRVDLRTAKVCLKVCRGGADRF